ncbi:short-chain dehydrogenase/reductase SDR [Lactarius deliciosus]|nr:short-chain dehydrogenase/reductase SDR [Lactarius deliciosus]
MGEEVMQVANHLSNNYGRGLLNGEGIGRSAALLFAKEGAKVVVSDLDEKKAQSVVDEIQAAGGDAIAVGGDVGADDFPAKILDATIKRYGKLNHIVNNAGFTYDRMLHTMPDDAWDIILKIHPGAGTPENRSIINVSSTSGLHGNVGQANYAAAKSAVTGFTKTIAKEWGAFGVRANTIAFGYILTRLTAAKEEGAAIEIGGKKVALGIPGAKTPATTSSADPKSFPLIPLARPGNADEAAAAMLFLASPLASYVTGHTLEVTGGR